jgi:hypothetical protein
MRARILRVRVRVRDPAGPGIGTGIDLVVSAADLGAGTGCAL